LKDSHIYSWTLNLIQLTNMYPVSLRYFSFNSSLSLLNCTQINLLSEAYSCSASQEIASIRSFINVFMKSRHSTLPSSRWIQFTPSHLILWRTVLVLFHLRLGLPRCLIPSRYPVET
jgi:hypothetical protein